MQNCLSSTWTALSRKKVVDIQTISDTDLKRCLNIWDLTALGVGGTLGSGVYVLLGQVAKNQAGPSIVISILIAALASLLAALCYSEFAARVPKAGSAYVYSYVSAGELWAFVIGWNMILECVIGASAVAKTWSQYFDAVFNDSIRLSIEKNIGTFNHYPGLAEFPDFISFVLLIIITIILIIGVKMSSLMNIIFTGVNIVVIIIIILVGVFYVDGKNWTDSPGFFPFGAKGIVSGAATCFYAFVGFDTIATSGEEAKEPSKHIPRAMAGTLIICTVAFLGVAIVMTLMTPWYSLADHAVLPKLFASKGLVGVQYVISVGGLCGMTASLIGSMFPVPRIIYSMSVDGLLFSFLSYLHPKTQTPIVATTIGGVVAAIMAFIMDLQSLVEMVSIGTLMAYTLVSVSVILLRYKVEHIGLSHDHYLKQQPYQDLEKTTTSDTAKTATEDTTLIEKGKPETKHVQYIPSNKTAVIRRVEYKDKNILGDLTTEEIKDAVAYPLPGSTQNLDNTSNSGFHSLSNLFKIGDDLPDEPTKHTSKVVSVSVLTISFMVACLCSVTIYCESYVRQGAWWTILLICIFSVLIISFTLIIARQPQNQTKLIFKCPLVPLTPLLSLGVNIYLMMGLSGSTWIRFAVWMTIGFLIYFGYGIWHSHARRLSNEQSEVVVYGTSDQRSIVSDDTVSTTPEE